MACRRPVCATGVLLPLVAGIVVAGIVVVATVTVATAVASAAQAGPAFAAPGVRAALHGGHALPGPPVRSSLHAVHALPGSPAGTGLPAREAQGQTPGALGLGRAPEPDASLAAVDVLPDGRGLPPGRGTVDEGRAVYASRCASCHGATGREGPNDPLAGGQGTLASARPVRTVGSYWPYATTLWDYINRAMPFAQPRTLTAGEVYAVTAFILQLNGIDVPGGALDQRTLPQVRMPNRDGFIPDQRRR